MKSTSTLPPVYPPSLFPIAAGSTCNTHCLRQSFIREFLCWRRFFEHQFWRPAEPSNSTLVQSLTTRGQISTSKAPHIIAHHPTIIHPLARRLIHSRWPRYEERRATIWATSPPLAARATTMLQTIQVHWMRFASRRARSKSI